MLDRQKGKIHSVGWKEIERNPTEFWRFRKNCYLCSKMSCTSMQIMQVCRNQNGCQLVTPSPENPHKLLIFSGLCDYSKDSHYLLSYELIRHGVTQSFTEMNPAP